MIRLLSGPVHSGKTAAAADAVDRARASGRSVGGVLCPGEFQNSVRSRVDVLNVADGARCPLVAPQVQDGERVGRFLLSREGLDFGRRALRDALARRPDLTVIDEVGPLELNGGGWAEETSRLINAYRELESSLLLIVVRARLVTRALGKWPLDAARTVAPPLPPDR